jgi:hypothetical protein
MASTELDLDLGRYKLGWSDAEDYVFKPKRGLDENIIKEMSWMKGEPDWMRDYRLKSYAQFLSVRCPTGAATCPRFSSTTFFITSSRPIIRSMRGTNFPTQ